MRPTRGCHRTGRETLLCRDARGVHRDAVAMAPSPRVPHDGAHDRNRTDDLLLTMEMLYRLSYVG